MGTPNSATVVGYVDHAPGQEGSEPRIWWEMPVIHSVTKSLEGCLQGPPGSKSEAVPPTQVTVASRVLQITALPWASKLIRIVI